MRQAPFGQDGAAAADNAGGAPRGHGDETEQDAGVNGEIIHALLALFDERVAINFPSQFLGFAADPFQRLINGHRADGDRRVAQNPLARGVDILAGGQIHHGVRAPLDRPTHLLHFLLHGGGDGGIADVGIDFDQEIAADDHRLQFRMVDVARNDGAAARHLGANKFGGDFPGDRGAEGLAGMLEKQRVLARPFGGGAFAPHVFAHGDVFHLRGDDAHAGVAQLRGHPAGLGAKRPRGAPGDLLDIAAAQNPLATQRGQAVLGVAMKRFVSPRAAAIVNPDRFIGFDFAIEGLGRVERDFAKGNAKIRVNSARQIDFLGTRRGSVLLLLGQLLWRLHHNLSRRKKARGRCFPSPALPGSGSTGYLHCKTLSQRPLGDRLPAHR